MRLALDTNAYSLLQKGAAPNLLRLTEGADEIALPFIVVGELRGGFFKGSKEAENTSKLDAFLGGDMVSVLYADNETVTMYAKLWADLGSRGKPIPTNDVWIAALCLQQDWIIATDDKHFDQVPLLRTIKVN